MNNLKGLHVLNTRPLKQAKALSKAIEAAGGISIECPALTIEPKDKSWLADLPDLNKVAKAIFISANAVNYCFRTLRDEQYYWPSTIEVIAVGDATAAALTSHGIKTDLIPAIADSENLLKLKELQEVNEKIILLVKGDDGRTLIAETLKTRGADLHSCEVYTRQLPKPDPQQLYSLWHNGIVDIILFTSQQAMHNLFVLFGEKARAWLCRTPCLVISKRLAEEAALLGIETIIISNSKTLLTTLHQFNQGLIHGRK
jgi:uroporphyrinogen-III synthase